jgi:probable HAF family extracellular repeat protein
MVGLGVSLGEYFRSYANGVSADGSVVVGGVALMIPGASSWAEAFRWTSGEGIVGLGDLPGGRSYSSAHGVSADSLVIVGGSDSTLGYEAFRWTSSDGMVGLGDLPGGDYFSHAAGVSADGAVVVGFSNLISSPEAFRWTSSEGMVGLGDLPGGSFDSRATAVSADGSITVGHSNSATGYQAFRWTSAEGMVGLGYLAGEESISLAHGVSANGSVVVGVSGSGAGKAFIWDASNGMRSLKDVLSELLSPADRATLDGWTLDTAAAISADGLTIVGYGRNPSGNEEAWAVYLGTEVPEPASWIVVCVCVTIIFVARRTQRFV